MGNKLHVASLQDLEWKWKVLAIIFLLAVISFHSGLLAQPPTCVVKINNPPAGCKPVDLTAAAITAGSDAGLSYTYWKDVDATVSLANPSSVTQSGTYYIKATNGSGCNTVKPVVVNLVGGPTGNINPATGTICK